MLGKPFTIQFLICLALLSACQSAPNNSYSTTADKETNKDISIEVSMAEGGNRKWLGLCWEENLVDVIIRNESDSAVYFYEDWNSSGFYNMSFEIETEDSVYAIKRTQKIWWKNFPSFHTLNPNQSLVFRYNLKDSACFEHSRATAKIHGFKEWIGFPDKPYEQAKIRAIFELPKNYRVLENPIFGILDSNPNAATDSLSNIKDSVVMFSEKLISEPLDITIFDEWIGVCTTTVDPASLVRPFD